MSVKLLKTIVRDVDNYQDGCFELDFLTDKRVYNEEIDENKVTRLIGNVYKLNTISLVGINAVGKTTTLNILSFILKTFINNESLNFKDKITHYFDRKLEVENYFYIDGYVYKNLSIIEKNDVLGSLRFSDEKLYKKKISKTTAKKVLFNFTEKHLEIDRNEIENPFLKSEDSIFSSILNKQDKHSGNYVRDMTNHTNFNHLSALLKNMPISFVQYLDPSIEVFELVENNPEKVKSDNVKCRIKFKGKEEFYSNIMDLADYLSSGTIKGINILVNATLALESGGYLLIDELENHLNKSIVINLIDLFTKDLNRSGATLIFTTHYSEILDSIDRTDSIYLFSKDSSIKINKWSKIADKKDRKDKKKSDLVLSGELNSTPSYQGYKKAMSDLNRVLRGTEDGDN